VSRLGYNLLHAANLLVVVSGCAYAWMLYLLEPIDEFALWNHPCQGLMREVHVVTAPLLVLMVGAAWAVHALPRLQDAHGDRRATGLTMALCFLPMALSGSLLQTSVSPGWETTWRVMHLAASALWTLAALVHFAAALQSRKRSSSGSPAARRSSNTTGARPGG
jgi:hypothetical protein